MSEALPQIGHNDNSRVYCDLCDWRAYITSFEEAEAMMQTHLLERHGKTLRYARETDSGAVKPTPEPEPEPDHDRPPGAERP